MTRTVLITGASTGIGKATAEHFHTAGWNVVATMRSPDESRNGERLLVTRLDVTEPGSVEEALRRALGVLFHEVAVAAIALENDFAQGARGREGRFPRAMQRPPALTRAFLA